MGLYIYRLPSAETEKMERAEIRKTKRVAILWDFYKCWRRADGIYIYSGLCNL